MNGRRLLFHLARGLRPSGVLGRAVPALALLGALVVVSAEEPVPYDLHSETYKTETLFSFDGCMDHRLMSNGGDPKVFGNHVYLVTIAHGRRPRILQVPLDGGDARISRLDPDYVIPDDSHQYFTLGIDNAGYIHLTGGMHGGPWKYWVSEKPEDISRFVAATPGEKAPPGFGITYPRFYKDARGALYIHSRASVPSFRQDEEGKIVHVGLLSAYDAGKRDWRVLGADIPKVFGGHAGRPASVWEDNFANGKAGGGWYVINTARFAAGRDNTLHFCFRVLNHSNPTQRLNDSDEGALGMDILYAVSRDGGRTLRRTDGTSIEWPVRAEAGPYQPDVIYSAAADYALAEKTGGAFPGLVGAGIQLDWKDRPMIHARRNDTGEEVVFRLEHGKWERRPPQSFGLWRDSAGVLMSPTDAKGEYVRRWDESHARIVKLGRVKIFKMDEDYFRDTGTMIYTTRDPRGGNRVINILRTAIQRPRGQPVK